MPVIPFIPLIISAVGGVAAAKVQSNAANKAAQIQEKAGTDALAFQRDVLSQQQQNSSPFVNAGTASLARLNSMLGGTSQPQPSIGREQTPIQGGGGFDPSQGVILVTAPNGETQERPASERQHWEALGAQIQGIARSGSVKAMSRQTGMDSLSALNRRVS